MDLEEALSVVLERRVFFAGEVSRPGRYEGAAPYVAYFDQLPGEDGLLVDDSESECTRWWKIEEGDVVLFPELKGREKVAVLTRNDGFVVEVPCD